MKYIIRINLLSVWLARSMQCTKQITTESNCNLCSPINFYEIECLVDYSL